MFLIANKLKGKFTMILYYKKLRLLRKKTGLQTKVFCERVGISVSTLWHWEKGSKTPPEKKVRKLAKVLGVSVEEISDLTSEHKKSDHDLSGIMSIWGGDSAVNNKEAEFEFKMMIDTLTKQHNSLMQYSLITKAILSSINSIIYIKDINLKYLVANKAFLYSLSLNEKYKVEGKTDFDFFSTTEAIEMKSHDEKVIATGKPLENITSFIPGSKKRKYALMSKFPIFDSAGKVAGVIGTYNDITEMRKASRTREILEIYIGAMTDCLSVFFSENYKYIYVNNAYAEVFGYPIEEFYKGGLIDFFAKSCVHPDDREIEEKYLREGVWPKSRTFRVVRPSGEIRWLEGSVNKRLYRGKECCISVNRDITDRIYKSTFSDMLEFILNNSNIVLWIREKISSGKLLYVSESVNKFYGYSEAVFYDNENFWVKNCLHPEDKFVKRFITAGCDGSDGATIICRVIGADGCVRWVETHCFEKDFLGKVCLCFVERDITKRKMEEKKILRQANVKIAMRLLSEKMNLEKVAEITQLTVDELKRLI
jgi:PAS domain S-box-containing protein